MAQSLPILQLRARPYALRQRAVGCGLGDDPCCAGDRGASTTGSPALGARCRTVVGSPQMATNLESIVVLELRAEVHDLVQVAEDGTTPRLPIPRLVAVRRWSLVPQPAPVPRHDEARRLVLAALDAIGAMPHAAAAAVDLHQPHLWISARLVALRELPPIRDGDIRFDSGVRVEVLTEEFRVQELNWPAPFVGEPAEFERAERELERAAQSLPTDTWTPIH